MEFATLTGYSKRKPWVVFLSIFFTGGDVSAADPDPLEANLRRHVHVLSSEIGERSVAKHDQLIRAAEYIDQQFRDSEYAVDSQPYEAHGRAYRNLIATRRGPSNQAEEIVVGAHYDTQLDTPGADDNASGVAVLLELARFARHRRFGKTLRFVAFTNEEMPSFGTAAMGSWVYARRAKAERAKIIGMISLEMVGYYSDEIHSQSYPTGLGWFFPNRGNFIALVSDLWSWRWKNQVERALAPRMNLPVESLATFGFVPGVMWSDHWSFIQEGYAALMITDTAFYRNPYYHRPSDTPDKLDYARMAELTRGLLGMLEQMAPVEESRLGSLSP